MTSFVALDDVTSFLRLKDVTNTLKRMRRGLSIGGSSSVQRQKVRRCWRLQICFHRLLCNKIEIDQLQRVICCVLGNYDKIISDTLEKQNRNGKNTRSLILVTNIHWQARTSKWIWQYIDWPRERSKPMKIGIFTKLYNKSCFIWVLSNLKWQYSSVRLH